MNRIIKEYNLTICRKEFPCEKCKRLVKKHFAYFKHDDGKSYSKICKKCFKSQVKQAIDILKTKMKLIESLGEIN